ncbi:hypothetical protein FP2506_04321 [Fulvimarina pelagi HTCC2506]|uniref:Uncharacterized protein n=2 Tax=Fulvimarina pelagi TaxID=217511 RepID=Q0G018_9HYPH|nr:hypothetical protein [Fulvimarina pelagi]EAU40423.1 hypothetical protein FP2506_04321 [Fulvimarina pelagi HTCC2506]BAT31453.1 hypothetical protein [Fulvimarina pelagi]
MMHDGSGMMSWMPLGMGLWGLLWLMVFILVIAALVKFLRR